MKKTILPSLVTVGLVLLVCAGKSQGDRDDSLLPYVNTMVGTAVGETFAESVFIPKADRAQVLPAVLEPNGMNFWTPQTRDTEKKGVVPYRYEDKKLQGFRASHWIVGGATQDYGSVTIMPLFGSLRHKSSERAAGFSHDNETSTPAYYSVELPGEGIFAEMTGRSRSGIFRFTYASDGMAYLVVTPNSDEEMGSVEIDLENGEIRGTNPVHRIYQGLGEYAGFDAHFVLKWKGELVEYGTFEGSRLHEGETAVANAKDIGAYLGFRVHAGERVLVKMATSFVSVEGAEKNLEKEILHWKFKRVRHKLERIWEHHLSQILIESEDEEAKTKFYSALYRASFLPRTFNDVDGRYPSFSTGTPIQNVHDSGNPAAIYYDDFSMWDTYRALHPLVNILWPHKAGDMMNSLLLKYLQGGWLPIFPCWNSYTSAMIGDHCISAICDAYVKGIEGFDVDLAYEAMRKNAFESPTEAEYVDGKGRRALKSYLQYGYVPLEDGVSDAFHKKEQVSRTLEYAYDDFALSQLAKALGRDEDFELLARRAQNYRNVIDVRSGYAQGRLANGKFLNPSNGGDHFSLAKFITEGAPCHYTWYVPHDVRGLMECMGGRRNFAAKLDSMCVLQLLWHGNEPCHHVPYLFNYAGTPWKTQRQVRHIMESEYLNSPSGLSGNDDAGQMSAWYIFSAMGFYPVCPATPYYLIGSPVFPSLEIKLENGKKFRVIAHGASGENIYIQEAKLDGETYDKCYITHDDILNGSTLEFQMGPEPNINWATGPESLPPSQQTPSN